MKLLTKIRFTAEILKAKKDELSRKVLLALRGGRLGASHAVCQYQLVFKIMDEGIAIFDKAITDPAHSKQLQGIIKNVIQDVANRTNEIGNFIDAISNDPEVKAAVVRIKESVAQQEAKVKEFSQKLKDLVVEDATSTPDTDNVTPKH